MKPIFKDIILFFFSFIIIFGGGVFFSDDIKSFFNSQIESEVVYSRDCENLTLRETADCLRDYISTFYNYTITDDDSFKGLDYMLEYGGDCADYSQLYESLGNSLGFYSEYVIIQTGNRTAHAFAVLSSDEKEYCILDQILEPYCISLKESNLTS